MTQLTLVGHRGARGEAPENTLPGFLRARDLALEEVELDLRLSADGELMVLHDKTLKRTAAISGRCSDYSAAELASVDARHSFPSWPQQVGIPRLVDVLDASSPTLRLQLEVKGDAMPTLRQLARQLASLIEHRQLADRVVVTSAHIGFLRLFGKRCPHIARGYIGEFRYLNPLKRALELKTDWLILNYKLVTPHLLARVTQHNLKLSVWTVNDLATAEKLVALGVNSLITDFPSAFQHHFQQVSLTR